MCGTTTRSSVYHINLVINYSANIEMIIKKKGRKERKGHIRKRSSTRGEGKSIEFLPGRKEYTLFVAREGGRKKWEGKNVQILSLRGQKDEIHPPFARNASSRGSIAYKLDPPPPPPPNWRCVAFQKSRPSPAPRMNLSRVRDGKSSAAHDNRNDGGRPTLPR